MSWENAVNGSQNRSRLYVVGTKYKIDAGRSYSYRVCDNISLDERTIERALGLPKTRTLWPSHSHTREHSMELPMDYVKFQTICFAFIYFLYDLSESVSFATRPQQHVLVYPVSSSSLPSSTSLTSFSFFSDRMSMPCARQTQILSRFDFFAFEYTIWKGIGNERQQQQQIAKKVVWLLIWNSFLIRFTFSNE